MVSSKQDIGARNILRKSKQKIHEFSEKPNYFL